MMRRHFFPYLQPFSLLKFLQTSLSELGLLWVWAMTAFGAVGLGRLAGGFEGAGVRTMLQRVAVLTPGVTFLCLATEALGVHGWV